MPSTYPYEKGDTFKIKPHDPPHPDQLPAKDPRGEVEAYLLPGGRGKLAYILHREKRLPAPKTSGEPHTLEILDHLEVSPNGDGGAQVVTCKVSGLGKPGEVLFAVAKIYDPFYWARGAGLYDGAVQDFWHRAHTKLSREVLAFKTMSGKTEIRGRKPRYYGCFTFEIHHKTGETQHVGLVLTSQVQGMMPLQQIPFRDLIALGKGKEMKHLLNEILKLGVEFVHCGVTHEDLSLSNIYVISPALELWMKGKIPNEELVEWLKKTVLFPPVSAGLSLVFIDFGNSTCSPGGGGAAGKRMSPAEFYHNDKIRLLADCMPDDFEAWLYKEYTKEKALERYDEMSPLAKKRLSRL